MPWTTWIDIEDETTSAEEVQKLYAKTRHALTKKVPDMVRLASATPEVSGLLLSLNQAIHRNATGLTVREQEIAALITASFNGCVH